MNSFKKQNKISESRFYKHIPKVTPSVFHLKKQNRETRKPRGFYAPL